MIGKPHPEAQTASGAAIALTVSGIALTQIVTMGKAAKIAANRVAAEINGAHPPQGAQVLVQGPNGGQREATRDELLMAFNRERAEHNATRSQREANMNQNATLIAQVNELAQVNQQLRGHVEALQKQLAEAQPKAQQAGMGRSSANGASKAA